MAKRSDGISITREYVNSKDPSFSLSVGETVNVNLIIEGLASSENYGVLEDQLPAGMVPINYRFDNEKKSESYLTTHYSYYYDYSYYIREYTQNGVIMSLYSVPSGKYTYSYKARVISEGEFLTPPATMSLMYSPEISFSSTTYGIAIIFPGPARIRLIFILFSNPSFSLKASLFKSSSKDSEGIKRPHSTHPSFHHLSRRSTQLFYEHM